MTREEAKQIISDIDKAYRNFTADEYKALDMAIQALSQEPCEKCKYFDGNSCQHYDYKVGYTQGYEDASNRDDAISRILKRMWNCRGKHTTSIDKVAMEQIIRDELPSVTQKPNFCASCKHNTDNEICLECEYDGITRGMTRYESVTQKSVLEDIKTEIKAEMEEHRDADDFSKGVGYGLRSAIGIIERCEDGK